MLRILLAVTTQLILLAAPAAALAQEGGDAQPRAARGRRGPRVQYTPVVLRLRHADCHEVAEMLAAMMPQGTVVADERTGSVVYAGPEETVETARDLVEELDVAFEESDTLEVVMVPIAHRGAEELARQVGSALASRELRVSADEGRSTVLLRGSEAYLNAARRILRALDTPAASVQLEFAFFHARYGPDADVPAENIPPDLAEVAKELKRFGRLELLGRLSTTAIESEEFAVEGGIPDSLWTRVRGTLAGAPTGGAVKLELQAELTLEKPAPAGEQGRAQRRSRLPGFELQTAVSTQRGDTVVLGSAPTGWAPGESAILVLHVRP